MAMKYGKAGMWSTIAAAIEAGWGPTARLLAVLAALGIVIIGFAIAAGDTGLGVIFHALFAESR